MADSAETEVLVPTDGTAFLRSLCDRYARRDGDKIIIDLPQPLLNALGLFLVEGIFGFLLGLGDPVQLKSAPAAIPPTKTGGRESQSISAN